MIKKILFDRKKMINILIGVSALMFCSLLTGSAKISGTGLTLWLVTVFWNVKLMLNSVNMSFGTILSEIDSKYETSKINKKRGLQLLYGITIPVMAVGLIMIVLILIVLFVAL